MEIDVLEYLDEDEIREACREAVKEYTRSKARKFFECAKDKNHYTTLFTTICHNYLVDNYKEELDFSVKACLDHITNNIFKNTWRDARESQLFKEVQRRLADDHKDFKKALLDKIRETDPDMVADMLRDVVADNLSKIFTTAPAHTGGV